MHVSLTLMREADALRGTPMIFELFERVQATLGDEVFATDATPRYDFSGTRPRDDLWCRLRMWCGVRLMSRSFVSFGAFRLRSRCIGPRVGTFRRMHVHVFV